MFSFPQIATRIAGLPATSEWREGADRWYRPGSLRPPWRPWTRTGLRGGRPSIWSSRPSAGGGLDDEDCDDEDSIHSHTSEEREGGAGGRVGSAGRVASRKLALGTDYRDDGRGCGALSGEQDPAQPTRLGPCRNGQDPSSQSIDIETSRITHTRAHTRAHSSINPLPPPSSPSSPSSPAPPAPSRCRPARGPERRPRAPAWCP